MLNTTPFSFHGHRTVSTPGLNTKEKEGHETTGDGAYLLCQDKTKQAKQDDRVSKKKTNSTSMPEPDDYCSLLSRRSQVTGETLQGSLI